MYITHQCVVVVLYQVYFHTDKVPESAQCTYPLRTKLKWGLWCRPKPTTRRKFISCYIIRVRRFKCHVSICDRFICHVSSSDRFIRHVSMCDRFIRPSSLSDHLSHLAPIQRTQIYSTHSNFSIHGLYSWPIYSIIGHNYIRYFVCIDTISSEYIRQLAPLSACFPCTITLVFLDALHPYEDKFVWFSCWLPGHWDISQQLVSTDDKRRDIWLPKHGGIMATDLHRTEVDWTSRHLWYTNIPCILETTL